MSEVSQVNNDKELRMGSLQIGPLNLTLHRTVRVDPEADVSSLPPSLGNFEIFKVVDFVEKCPETWDEDGYFIALHEVEAMWMNFSCWTHPVALLIGAGGINAVDGEKLKEDELQEGNYVVTPPQPWLDGFKGTDGTVYQFVATQYKDGEGKSVGEQILKSESVHGGIQISLFEPNEEWKEKLAIKNEPYRMAGAMAFAACCDSMPQFAAGSGDLESIAEFSNSPVMQEMGVGKGGKIDQKVYEDPHGIKAWEKEPKHKVSIYLVNGPMFASITGRPIQELPPDFKSYEGIWFNVDDKHLKDVSGTDKFDELETTN